MKHPRHGGAHLNSASEGGAKPQEGSQENPQDQDGQEDNWWGVWNPQETLSALMALKGNGKGKAGGREEEHAGSVDRQDTRA